MSYIANIHARQILDSRGNPTVEVDIFTENEFWAEQQCHPVQVQVYMKQSNCVMKIKKYMEEKVY